MYRLEEPGLARQLGVPLPVILLAVAALVAASGLLVPAALRSTGTRDTVDGPPRPEVRRRRVHRAGIGVGALAACMLIVENAVEQWSAVLLENYRHAVPVVASSGPAVYYLASRSAA